MKRAYLLRGWGGYSIWFKSEKRLLEKLGYEVIIPKLPTKYFPFNFLWSNYLKRYNFHPEDIVIGKSLGGTLFLNFLTENDVKIDALFLIGVPVGGKFSDFYDKISLNNLCSNLKILLFLAIFGYKRRYDWQKVKENTNKIHLIYKNNDFLVPLEEGKYIAKNLGVELNHYRGNDHCNEFRLELINRELTEGVV